MSKILIIIAVAIAIIVIAPVATIWALNTLFPVLAIPYSLETWSAAVLLHIFFSKSVEIKKDKE